MVRQDGGRSLGFAARNRCGDGLPVFQALWVARRPRTCVRDARIGGLPQGRRHRRAAPKRYASDTTSEACTWPSGNGSVSVSIGGPHAAELRWARQQPRRPFRPRRPRRSLRATEGPGYHGERVAARLSSEAAPSKNAITRLQPGRNSFGRRGTDAWQANSFLDVWGRKADDAKQRLCGPRNTRGFRCVARGRTRNQNAETMAVRCRRGRAVDAEIFSGQCNALLVRFDRQQ